MSMTKNIPVKTLAAFFSFLFLAGCLGGFRKIKVTDFTDQRVGDLTMTKKVIGKREFLFFSTVRTGTFLEGSIQGLITDYSGNPIEGVTVKVLPDTGPSKNMEDAGGALGSVDVVAENSGASVNLSFAPGMSDTMGLYKIRFSLPVNGDTVDVRGKLVYNPGWDQQKINLGKAYEPQMKESPFRLYYNFSNGFLAFAEGVRKTIVQPVGEGQGHLQALPGVKAPATIKPSEPASAQQPAGADKTEEDLFKGFDFGQ